MADDGFSVRPSELRAHADAVDGIGGLASQAQQAGNTVILGREAYGILCSFVPWFFDPVQRAVVRVLGESAEKLHQTAGSVRVVASEYTGADETVATSYDQTRPGGPSPRAPGGAR